jgi:hypothetical protein
MSDVDLKKVLEPLRTDLAGIARALESGASQSNEIALLAGLL